MASLLASPSVDAQVLATLTSADGLQVEGTVGGAGNYGQFYRVTTPDGMSGYVYEANLRPI